MKTKVRKGLGAVRFCVKQQQDKTKYRRSEKHRKGGSHEG